MILREEFYINCDGIRLHCKSDRPEPAPAGATPQPGDAASQNAVSVPQSPKIPLVLVIPGLTGHMEEPHIVAVAEALAKNGYASLRCELYGHGKSEGLFHDHTLFHWALEIMYLIDYARNLDYVSELYLCGHSQGGAAAVLGAGLKPDALKGLILLAPAMLIKDVSMTGGFPVRFFDPDHIPDETLIFEEEPISGNYYRVCRMLPFDDAIALYGGKPVLVVHSRTDELVPFRYGEQTAAAYQNAELVTIEEDDHCFETHIDRVTDAMIRFLDHLTGHLTSGVK